MLGLDKLIFKIVEELRWMEENGGLNCNCGFGWKTNSEGIAVPYITVCVRATLV